MPTSYRPCEPDQVMLLPAAPPALPPGHDGHGAVLRVRHGHLSSREVGTVKRGTVTIDGTKVKASASRHEAMSDERMQQAEVEHKAQSDALLARAKATDETEANEPELDLPAEIERREIRLAAYRKRKWIAEPPNGWIKNVLGFRHSACGGCTGCKPSGSSYAWR